MYNYKFNLIFFLAGLVILLATTPIYGQQPQYGDNAFHKIPQSVWKITLEEYLQRVNEKKPSITGGCVTLTSATLSATLFLMALDISQHYALPGDSIKLAILISSATSKRDSLAMLSDTDNYVFQKFIDAGKLPHKTIEERQARDSVMHLLLVKATNSPLNAATLICKLFTLYNQGEALSSKNVYSDIKSSECLLDACFRALVILTTDNISQLPIDEGKIFQTKIQDRIITERLLYKGLNNTY